MWNPEVKRTEWCDKSVAPASSGCYELGHSEPNGKIVPYPFPFHVYVSGEGWSNNITPTEEPYPGVEGAVGVPLDSFYLGEFFWRRFND